jgi:hypothetical protein
MLSEALDTDEHGMKILSHWFRRWAENGQVTGGERTLLSVAKTSATTPEISTLFFQAATDRMYAHDGQAVFMTNKGFELIECLGRDAAKDILPTIVRWVSSRGSGAEDRNNWNHPVDLVTPLREAEKQIAAWMEQGKGKTFAGDEELKKTLLGDDPHVIINSIGKALSDGASTEHLARLVAYAAGRRLAHFSLTNELQDWLAPARTFSYANAMHQVIKRSPPDALLTRGIFHGAIAVYMDRFLNVPAVKLPGERSKLDDLPSEPEKLCAHLLQLLDRQANIEEAARTVARYVRLKLPLKSLINTLMMATAREDHWFQFWLTLDAGVQQALAWGAGTPEAEHILVGAVRYLAAFCPTPRAEIKSAQVGLRLNRGEHIYEDKRQPAETA